MAQLLWHRIPANWLDREIVAAGPYFDDDDILCGHLIVSNFGIEAYDTARQYLGCFPTMEQALRYIEGAHQHNPIVRGWN